MELDQHRAERLRRLLCVRDDLVHRNGMPAEKRPEAIASSGPGS